ncbi:hypothetical protein CHLNCDRAFT_144191 [Chlorella variabilis]|uniref:FAS1 domain-containing protein n=1 Tax=Chlorella variabilis TaxID=554065 RepID=E1ZC44_CHLVA|nr:hypothetical protein CHLNCDRAFT_144191 [Chlorella variabilis]EFN56544.1 hypothetical protein CHLNCDRAFT_144191 [Chlorella variabilis]|eukprot:XP_005848646.1 hypothetical protein CHLNCDRAFT_144191 [Chlorella variabilis]
MRALWVLITLLQLHHGIGCAQAAAAVAAGGATWAQPALQPHRRLLANDTGGSSSSSSSSSSGTAAQGALSTRKRCAPSLVDVARQQPELRQAVQLARSGYNLFSVDGGKPFTVLVPTNDALQQLAAGIDSLDDQLSLEDGFYSVLLYHQIPQGAYDVSQLVQLGNTGLQTSLGRALGGGDNQHTVTFDGATSPVVATGGWPANNAQLVRSLQACNGWLHVVDRVLLPTQMYSDLPRLVDDTPDLQNGSFWGLLDGSGLDPAVPAPAADYGAALSPAPAEEGGQEEGHHSNTTDVAVSSGNGEAAPPSVPANATSSSASNVVGGGSSEKVLVIAASVAGAAVAACAAVVAAVLLRKHAARRRRGLGRGEGMEEEEEAGGGMSPSAKRSHSLRPVQLHVDA